jgi:PAS domain S-box-containing protein
MKSQEPQKRGQLPHLGFFARLSNIILIQGVFVFAAVALVLFYPRPENPMQSTVVLPEGELRTLADKVSRVLAEADRSLESIREDDKLKSLLFSLILPEKKIAYAGIFIPDDDSGFSRVFTFHRPWWSDGAGSKEQELGELIDPRMIHLTLEQPTGIFIPPVHSTRYSVYYYPFQAAPKHPAVLAAVSEHGLVISSRSQLQYALLVLFLSSILVSLLTVYLISRRFKEPLSRLIHGLEKTTEGELYYMIEAEGDRELRKLTAAFNKMSRTLWENHKRLRKYNHDLKKANLALLESQLFLATLVDSTPLCVVAASSEGKIMIFNREASKVFGYRPSEAVGLNIERLFSHPPDANRQSQLTSGDPSKAEVLCRRCDGSIFPAYLITAPVRTKENAVIAHLYIIRDISESKSFQEMMIRLDRYSTRGEMAGEIAHEINNYLTVLSGNMELIPLLLESGDTDKVRKRLEVMRQTVEKIARFTDGLMDAGPDETRLVPADLNQLVENTVAFLKPQNKFDNIEITTNLSRELPLVEMDVSQIQQVLVNLLYNAADALQGTSGEKKIWVTTSVTPGPDGKLARVEVRDNGPGVVTDKEELLFVKRFTTKRKGHGIGLITCRRIIEAHHGSIAYRKDGGAVFTFEIPVKRKAAPTPTTGESTVQTTKLVVV